VPNPSLDYLQRYFVLNEMRYAEVAEGMHPADLQPKAPQQGGSLYPGWQPASRRAELIDKIASDKSNAIVFDV
jgi:hypothetical protein